MNEALRKMRRIPVLTEAGVLTLWFRVALWVLPFRTIDERLPRPPAPNKTDDPRRLTTAIARVSRFIPRATCLTQALAGHVLLARHGIRSEIHVGVRKDPETGFDAHAWLVCGADVLIGSESREGFAALTHFGESRF